MCLRSENWLFREKDLVWLVQFDDIEIYWSLTWNNKGDREGNLENTFSLSVCPCFSAVFLHFLSPSLTLVFFFFVLLVCCWGFFPTLSRVQARVCFYFIHKNCRVFSPSSNNVDWYNTAPVQSMEFQGCSSYCMECENLFLINRRQEKHFWLKFLVLPPDIWVPHLWVLAKAKIPTAMSTQHLCHQNNGSFLLIK